MTRTTKLTIALAVASTLFFGVLLLSLQPVPAPTADNTLLVEGEIKSVELDEQTHDLVLQIEGDRDTYYINSGLETDWLPDEVSNLTHKNVSLYYIKTSNPLEFIARKHHVSRIAIADEIVFDEMESFSSIDLAAN